MELRKPIPSRITIAHYPVNVFYRGQLQQRFRCEQTGHLSRECPLKNLHGFLPSRIRGPTTVQPSGSSNLVTRSNDGSLAAGSTIVQLPAHGDPPFDDSLVVNPPAGDSITVDAVHVPSDAFSSTSTPVNVLTGKRQHKPDDSVDPSAKINRRLTLLPYPILLRISTLNVSYYDYISLVLIRPLMIVNTLALFVLDFLPILTVSIPAPFAFVILLLEE